MKKTIQKIIKKLRFLSFIRKNEHDLLNRGVRVYS